MNDMQRTPEWFAQRRGCLGASRVADAIRKTKTGYSAARLTYMAELIAERLIPHEAANKPWVNKDMQRGIDMESEARSAYEMVTGNIVEEVGSLPHPDIAKAGASPDGTVGNGGGIEVKVPKPETHIKTLMGGEIDPDYLMQIHWQMACAGFQWVDFVSYCPELPAQMRLFIKRVERDEKMIIYMEQEVVKFLKEVDDAIEALLVREIV